jgi:hypothetical protein
LSWLSRTLLFAQIAAATSPSHAVDLAFGVDSLPVLTDAADVIAVVRSIEPADRTDDYRVYGAVIAEVVVGNASLGSRVLFAVPQLLDLEQDDLDKSALLFLSGPMDRATSVDVLGRNAEALFWLAGGSAGRIEPTNARISAIRSYKAFQEDEPRSPWITTQLRSNDELLQRSALIELAKPRYADDVATYNLLGATAMNPSAAEPVQDLAQELLHVSASPLALPALKAIALAEATTPERRTRAIRSIGSIEGGEAELRDLAGDPATRTLATAELRRLSGFGPGEPSSASVLEGLASGDVRIRAQAISDLRRTAVTGDTVPVVAPLIDPSASTNLGERAILIDHLGTVNSDDAAALLERVARDRSQSEPVRNAALLALARMDPRVASGALRTLATGLEDGTLKDLAELLAE